MNTPLRHVVAGVATLGPDDPALAPSIRLAERTGAELTLVHVFDAVGADARSATMQARLEAEARALTARGRISCRVVPGRAGDVLPQLAAELGADLLVLGHTRRGGVASVMLGITAQRVLRASTVPVLSLAGGPAHAGYGRALLASDLSPHSAHALAGGAELVRALAHPAEPQLRPLFVAAPAYDAVVAWIPESPPERSAAMLREFLGEIPALAGLAGAVRTGDAANEILAEAAEWHAELVVVGTHGRRGVPRLLLGSVAESVLRRAHVSVLAIPPATVLRPATDARSVTEDPPSLAAEGHASGVPLPASPTIPARGRRARLAAVPTRCILAATDLSDASDHVLRSAAAVAAATGAALHVIHAFDFASPAYMGQPLERPTFQARIAAAEVALDTQIARTVPPEVRVAGRRVEIYATHRAIAERAEAASAELVVVGAHTHHGTFLGVLGSTTDRLIRTLRVPCLVVRTELGIPLHRVVVPLDLSDPARAALEIGVRWASALGARGGDAGPPETEVAVVHVVPQFFAVAEPPFNRATVPPGLDREIDAVKAAGSPPHVLVHDEVLWNDRPATEILSYAR
ncbi:MAG: universal stress protein, partial [Longimicrobiaceae bacterium]